MRGRTLRTTRHENRGRHQTHFNSTRTPRRRHSSFPVGHTHTHTPDCNPGESPPLTHAKPNHHSCVPGLLHCRVLQVALFASPRVPLSLETSAWCMFGSNLRVCLFTHLRSAAHVPSSSPSPPLPHPSPIPPLPSLLSSHHLPTPLHTPHSPLPTPSSSLLPPFSTPSFLNSLRAQYHCSPIAAIGLDVISCFGMLF